MAVGTFQIYSEALEGLFLSTMGSLQSGPVTAVLLGAGYSPNLETHDTWSDVSTFEITGTDYAPVAVSGLSVTDKVGGAGFTSSDVTFTTTGSISDAKYFLLVMGNAASLSAGDRLVGLVDLDTSSASATVSSVNGEFTVQTPAGGWFDITRS